MLLLATTFGLTCRYSLRHVMLRLETEAWMHHCCLRHAACAAHPGTTPRHYTQALHPGTTPRHYTQALQPGTVQDQRASLVQDRLGHSEVVKQVALPYLQQLALLTGKNVSHAWQYMTLMRPHACQYS
jgi:hypothetical protein